MDKILNDLQIKFEEVFQTKSDASYFAPGRVNLIGEHTDYNGGHVFPCSLDFGTYLLLRKRDDKQLRFYSVNFDALGVIEVNLETLVYDKKDNWTNYPKGVIDVMQKLGNDVPHGFDFLFFGNIPNGAGLSSSASVEMVTAVAVDDVFGFGIDRVELVKISQRAENEFVGVNCGIMDQFAIGMGKKDHAILLDTNTLKYEYAKLEMDGVSIVIANTNKRRGLADSKYNERRSECELAVEQLNTKLDIKTLGELSVEEFEANKELIESEVVYRRARHAVTENIRTKRSVEALRNNDLKLFGELMNQSHISLRDDYEVTGNELDTLVSFAWEANGVLGARMTGAGFGGCTVSLVKDENVDEFIETVGKKYEEAIGYKADFYVANIGDGAMKL
jgi:galactokinase